eukprot:scaffold1403_cov180-Ochromonas_danica.AAC.29
MFIIIIFLLIIAIASSAASIESNKKDNKNNPPLPCPSYTTIKEFHNLITLPEVAVPNKISFRSCVSRKRETVVASIEGPGTGNKDRPERCVRTQDAMMMILRIYYDDSSTPSVEAPLGAFFGIYHNREDSWGNTKSGYGADNSLFKISENGAFTLIAPLPFEKRIKITLVNEDPQNVSMRAWAQRGPVLALNKHLPSLAQRFGESTTADISKNNPMLPPPTVYINGHIVYREVNSLSGFHSFRVDTKKMKLGQNEFLVQFANRDNTNSRAFLFGLQLHLSDHLRNGRLRKEINIPSLKIVQEHALPSQSIYMKYRR